ncbi:MAG TPA: hypothetical protein PLI59_03670, partial [Candidatus Obscuribacter sp.]|nr:hypothetical protein [Candidatus Obscuribacter sp.]
NLRTIEREHSQSPGPNSSCRYKQGCKWILSAFNKTHVCKEAPNGYVERLHEVEILLGYKPGRMAAGS